MIYEPKKDNQQPEKLRNQPSDSVQQQPNKKNWPCLWYLLTWLMFILAYGVYVGIWAVDRYAVTQQQSYFYASAQKISPYIDSPTGVLQSSCDFTVGTDVTTQSVFSTQSRLQAISIALPLLWTWIMWKFPLNVYTLDVIWVQENKIMRFVPWACALILQLAFDILLFIFIPLYYNQWFFYAFYAFLSFILVFINNRANIKSGLSAIFFPLFFIALLYSCYCYFFPALYGLYLTNVPEASVYLQIYLFPLWDVLIYALYLTMNAKVSVLAQKFISYINFFILGYFVGMTMLVGITEVQFYYLIAYMLFRNFFVNWVMWKWEHVVNLTPVLPGWGVVYYISYLLNFLPLNGIGQLTISKGYYSEQYGQACLLLYYIPTSLYPYSNPTNTQMPTDGLNLQLIGYIFWPAALIIWAVSTFSQKYPRKKPNAFEFFYILAGIFMFYIGLSGALQIIPLSQVAMK